MYVTYLFMNLPFSYNNVNNYLSTYLTCYYCSHCSHDFHVHKSLGYISKQVTLAATDIHPVLCHTKSLRAFVSKLCTTSFNMVQIIHFPSLLSATQ